MWNALVAAANATFMATERRIAVWDGSPARQCAAWRYMGADEVNAHHS